LRTPTKDDLIYAACAIDCEGCITIHKVKNKNRIGRVYYTFGAKIIVGNTNRILIDWFYDIWGGLRQIRRKPNKDKDCYLWQLSKKEEASDFLKAILPYLKMKKEQAKCLLEYYDLFYVNNPELRLTYWNRMSDLNRKGKSVTTNTLNDTKVKAKVSKIESELIGDNERALMVTLETAQPELMAV
jgi:hypothetical protein